MSEFLAECRARVISDPWNEETTKIGDVRAIAQAWRYRVREGKLRVWSDALQFEDWRIPYTELDDAVVTRVQAISPSYFPRIKVKGKPYQFAIQKGGSFFKGDLPFPVRRASARGFTWTRALVRLLIFLTGIALLILGTRKKHLSRSARRCVPGRLRRTDRERSADLHRLARDTDRHIERDCLARGGDAGSGGLRRVGPRLGTARVSS